MENGTITIKGVENLKKEILINDKMNERIPTPLVVIGGAGIGKTYNITEICQGLCDELHVVRLSNLSDEDFIGMPHIDSVTDVLEFKLIGPLERVRKNPDKKIYIILDEINRVKREHQAPLFAFLEGIIRGEHYPNLRIVCAMNFGENYSVDDGLFDDYAFRNRLDFINFIPTKVDGINFFKKQGYNEHLIAVAQKDNVELYDFIMKGDEESYLEQPTTFRGWRRFDARIKALEEISGEECTLEDVSNEFKRSGERYFNNKTGQQILKTFNDLIKIKTLDVKDVLKKGVIPDEFKQMEYEILLRVKDLVVDNLEAKFLEKNSSNIIKLFKGEWNLLSVIIQELKMRAKTHQEVEELSNALIVGFSDEDVQKMYGIIFG